jgi:hypothetical protein
MPVNGEMPHISTSIQPRGWWREAKMSAAILASSMWVIKANTLMAPPYHTGQKAPGDLCVLRPSSHLHAAQSCRSGKPLGIVG